MAAANNPATDFAADLAELESAEDFLEYFDVPYVRDVVQVSRLHILQRFHDYLATHCGPQPSYDDYRSWLMRAHDDFVASTPLREKVFSVLKRGAGIATVPLSAIGRAG